MEELRDVFSKSECAIGDGAFCGWRGADVTEGHMCLCSYHGSCRVPSPVCLAHHDHRAFAPASQSDGSGRVGDGPVAASGRYPFRDHMTVADLEKAKSVGWSEQCCCTYDVSDTARWRRVGAPACAVHNPPLRSCKRLAADTSRAGAITPSPCFFAVARPSSRAEVAVFADGQEIRLSVAEARLICAEISAALAILAGQHSVQSDAVP
jgi:hypothetical protein